MSDLVAYTSRAPERSFAADWLLDPAEIAQRIGGTDFVPEALRNNPAAITAALLYGAEVGLGRMQSLAKIAVINGRPTLAAEAQRALILHAGHELWIEELSATRCTVAGRRRDSEQISRVTWTLDDARRANLAGKPPWRLYPRQMLLARASAELARAVFPDAIGGLAATEELQDDGTEANGAAPEAAAKPATTRRKRRSPAASAPSTPAKAEGEAPGPPAEPEAAEAVTTPPEGAGELPPAEAALVEQARRDFDASERRDVPQGAPAPEAPEPTAEPMSDAQRKRIHAMFREAGIADRGERLRYCGGVVGRELGSSNELTSDEASRIIDHLQQYDPNNPQTHPLPDTF